MTTANMSAATVNMALNVTNSLGAASALTGGGAPSASSNVKRLDRPEAMYIASTYDCCLVSTNN